MTFEYIMACVPINGNQIMAALGSDLRYEPGPDYILVNCESCQIQMWMGPNQVARYNANFKLYRRLCMPCIKLIPGEEPLVVSLSKGS